MSLSYNLQYFAKDGPDGEKTEEPTGKRRTDARKEGQVAKSKELYNGISLLFLFLVVKLYIGHVGNSLLGIFPTIYNKIPDMVVTYAGEFSYLTIFGILRGALGRLVIIVLPIFILGAVIAFVVDLLQVKWAPTKKPLQPKFSKLNPAKGLGKLFSKSKLVELLKSVVKILLVSYVAYDTIKDEVGVIFSLYNMSLLQSVQWLGSVLSNMGLKIAAFYLIIGAVDLFYEKHKHHEELKMTKQEVKDEMKNAEGDPKVKAQLRQKMLQASMRRMMQSVPKADVVITNPTHYAVAIKYDAEKYAAPMVLAKGEDYLAQKIKEKAKESNIEIVENKPLARMLYANVEVGELVPPELYQAVAEVLAMVYQMQGKL